MQVELFKKMAKYEDQEGKERTATNFFVKCGDVMVPVEVKYFEDKQTHEDRNYRQRKSIMSAFADELTESKK